MLHRTLERQIRRFLGDNIPADWENFLKAISDTYVHFDEDRALLDRSLEVSSKEFNDLILREQKLKNELADLNTHLQEKIDEQTKEIKNAYEVEKRARIDLEELDKTKTQFILTTQHHLRTPITIAKGYIEFLLAKKADEINPTVKGYLDKILVSTEQMAKLVNDFLDISALRVGKEMLNKTLVDMESVFDEIIQELNPEIEAKRIAIAKNFSENSMAIADRTKIKEALYNILNNSVKYNKDGGSITISSKIVVHPIEKDKQFLQFYIEDTGIGLNQKELDGLFDKYFERGEEAKNIYTTGKGIGMALTKAIIQAHDGRIWAESRGRDMGSKFTILLPTPQ